MDVSKRQAQRIRESIREVLLREWDPIGAAERDPNTDEYDAFVAGVYHRLLSGATDQELLTPLGSIEVCEMAITPEPGEPHRNRHVVTKLLAIDLAKEDADG